MKIRKKKVGPNKLDELKCAKSMTRQPNILTNMLFYTCMLTSKHLFIYPIKNKNKKS